MSTEVLTGTNVPEDEAKARFKELLAAVSANPADLKFPTDKWGFTAGVRREVLRAASSVRGQDEKHDLLVMTLAILIQHIHARKPKDKEAFASVLARRKAAAEGRAVKEVYGRALENPARAKAEVVSTSHEEAQ